MFKGEQGIVAGRIRMEATKNGEDSGMKMLAVARTCSGGAETWGGVRDRDDRCHKAIKGHRRGPGEARAGDRHAGAAGDVEAGDGEGT